MYHPKSIEPKWQKFWEEHDTFRTLSPAEAGKKPKKYVLSMFPYPSGEGLHVGHAKVYSATDAYARYCKTRGYNVLHPMGWDAFGLPAENYAIKTGTHPAITTAKNVANYTRQMKSIGLSYDWSREINTTDIDYIKQTQWIFLQLFERGLAYEQDLPINYCPSCKTGLANEEVVGDNKCDRCGTTVERRKIRQWVLKITEYAERLLEDIDTLDWPESIKEMQRNWIGKSEGVEFEMRKAIINPFEKGGQGGLASKPVALILHWWEDDNTVNRHWQTWLKNNLEISWYEVIMPHLPNPFEPDLKKQLAFLEQYKGKMTEGSMVVGHSMGAFLAMHFVQRLDTKIDKLICVAPVFNGLVDYVDWSNETIGWEVGSASMKMDYNPEKIKQNTKDWNVFLSKNDEHILYPQAKSHFDSIGVSHIDIENAGHFCERDGYATFPQLLKTISSSLAVYTTRIDTVYGMTYVVLAMDHKDVNNWITPEQKSACEKYIAESKAKSDQERTNEGKEKTGVFTGSYVVNPFNGEQIPVWIGDYVLGSYGTGAVMAVPAHDERDFEFARKMGLEIKNVVYPNEYKSWMWYGNTNLKVLSSTPWDGDINKLLYEAFLKNEASFLQYWVLKDSWEFSEKDSLTAQKLLAEKAESEGFGKKKTNYKLRDWLFSRQRYWGEPIPLVHLAIEDLKKLPHISSISQATDPNLAYILKRDEIPGECIKWAMCGCSGKVRELIIGGKAVSKIYDGLYGKIICDYRLPLELPSVEKYEPSGDGNSPLALVESFVNVTIASNLTGKRETNTMPQWAGSCWYYLRFMDPKYPDAPARKEMIDYWSQVDKYIGGAEHAVLHLLYARFWHKVLFDIGVVSFKEPFQDLISVGLILGPDGAKMSKSKGNVINPDDVVKEYGADTLRMYELSISDFRDAAPWNTEAIIGVRRFLERSLAIFETPRFASDDTKAMKLLHKTIKKVGEDIEAFKFNTAISALMILLNEGIPKDSENTMEWKETFSILLHPFTPHLAEELWSMLGKSTSIFEATWPEYLEFMLVDDEVTIAIQVNGKLRGAHTFPHGVAQEGVSARALEDPEILKWVGWKQIVREIFVPNKLLSIVVK